MPYDGVYHCYTSQLQSKDRILQIAEIAKEAVKKLPKQAVKCRMEEILEKNGMSSSDDEVME